MNPLVCLSLSKFTAISNSETVKCWRTLKSNWKLLEHYMGFHIQSQNFEDIHFFLWKTWCELSVRYTTIPIYLYNLLRVASTSMNIYIFIFTHNKSHFIIFTIRVVCLNTKSQNIYFHMLSKLLYIIQILLLKENYKQKWNARGQKNLIWRIHEKCEQRHLHWYCLYCIFFFLFIRLKIMIVAFLGNRLHHKLSLNLLKTYWNMYH